MNFYQRPVLMAFILAGAALLSAGCGGEEPADSQAAGTAAPGPSATASESASPFPSAQMQTEAPANSGKVHSIAFDAKEATVEPGKSRTLGLKALSSKQEIIPLPDQTEVRYTSDKPDMVEVDAEGRVKPGPNSATGSKATITAEYNGKTAFITVTVKYALEDTIAVSGNKAFVTNVRDTAVVVNKKRALPESYAPQDLIEPKVPFSFTGKNDKRMLRKEAAHALEKLFELARKDGIKLYGVSGYRSYATQERVYNNNVKTQGEQEANKVSAIPGHSEHQTGLAIDVSSVSANFALEESFGATAEGKWLAAHAHEAGFIIRYPKGKEAITGYSYEPWHIRYVGELMAKDIYENKWTLEEYFRDAVPVNG